MLNIGNKRIRLTKLSTIFSQKQIFKKVTTLKFTRLFLWSQIKESISNNFVLKFTIIVSVKNYFIKIRFIITI